MPTIHAHAKSSCQDLKKLDRKDFQNYFPKMIRYTYTWTEIKEKFINNISSEKKILVGSGEVEWV